MGKFRIGSCLFGILLLLNPSGLWAQPTTPINSKHLCFVSGYKGGGNMIQSVFPQQLMAQYSISMKVFVPSYSDRGLEQHADDLKNWFQNQINLDPSFKCVALIGYSMGGILMRLIIEEMIADPVNQQFIPVKNLITGAIVLLASPTNGFEAAAYATGGVALQQMTPQSMLVFNDPSSSRYSPWPVDKWIFTVATYMPDLSYSQNYLESYFWNWYQTQLNKASDGLVSHSSQVGAFSVAGYHLANYAASHSWPISAPEAVNLYAQIYTVVKNIFDP